MSYVIRQFKYFESDRKHTPINVRLPLDWVLGELLPSTSEQLLYASKLSNRLRVTSNWQAKFEVATACKSLMHLNRLTSDDRGQKILEDTTNHDGCRTQLGMFWADDESSLPINYFSVLLQLKSLECCLDKNSELKIGSIQTKTSDLDKGYIVQVDKNDFKVDCPL